MTNQEFIDQIAVYIKKYAAIFGICVHSPIIAQAILESGWGKSKLAATYHNYFGLKCGTKWTLNLSSYPGIRILRESQTLRHTLRQSGQMIMRQVQHMFRTI